MQPKLYHPGRVTNNAKPVQLDMRTDDSNVFILAVDERGEPITRLIVFTENEVIAVHNAKKLLERSGYDTTFADWNRETGAMMVLSE